MSKEIDLIVRIATETVPGMIVACGLVAAVIGVIAIETADWRKRRKEVGFPIK